MPYQTPETCRYCREKFLSKSAKFCRKCGCRKEETEKDSVRISNLWQAANRELPIIEQTIAILFLNGFNFEEICDSTGFNEWQVNSYVQSISMKKFELIRNGFTARIDESTIDSDFYKIRRLPQKEELVSKREKSFLKLYEDDTEFLKFISSIAKKYDSSEKKVIKALKALKDGELYVYILYNILHFKSQEIGRLLGITNKEACERLNLAISNIESNFKKGASSENN